jgi:hypothetical protein
LDWVSVSVDEFGDLRDLAAANAWNHPVWAPDMALIEVALSPDVPAIPLRTRPLRPGDLVAASRHGMLTVQGPVTRAEDGRLRAWFAARAGISGSAVTDETGSLVTTVVAGWRIDRSLIQVPAQVLLQDDALIRPFIDLGTAELDNRTPLQRLLAGHRARAPPLAQGRRRGAG